MENAQRLLSGFSDPVTQSQQVFRKVLDAMSHPGQVQDVTIPGDVPTPLSPAAAAVCLSLLDFETPLWLDLDAQAAQPYLGFHCHCPVAKQAHDAAFGVVSKGSEIPALHHFHMGTDEHPERSTTLIVEVDALSQGSGLLLTGPGIADQVQLRVEGLTTHSVEQIQQNHALFPRGLDFILTCGNQIAALPRTSKVEMA